MGSLYTWVERYIHKYCSKPFIVGNINYYRSMRNTFI